MVNQNNPQTTGTSPIEPSSELKETIEALLLKFEGVEPEEDSVSCMLWLVKEAKQQVLSELLDSLPEKMGSDPTRDNDIDRGRRFGHNVAIDQVTEAIKLKIKEVENGK